MRVWTKSACVLLVWWLVLAVMVAAGARGPTRPAPASARIARSTEITLASALGAARAAGPTVGPATRYVVQPGDSLSGIATALGVRGGWPALYAANRAVVGLNPDVIIPGAVLVLPGPRAPVRYTVAAGDTLSGVATALGVRGGWPALYAANRAVVGPNPNVLRPGTVLTIAGPPPVSGQHPAPPPPPTSSPRPSHHPAPGTHRGQPRPTTAHAVAATGMPQWLKTLLIVAGLIIAAAFIVEPVLMIRRKRRSAASRPAPGGSDLATNGSAPVPAGNSVPVPAGSSVPVPAGSGPPTGQQARIVLIDSDRLVVVRCTQDGTVYVLRPPGSDPAAILRVARLVLPEFRYGELASQFGMPASWPIVMADYDRLVVTCSKHDGTVYVLRPPGEDPRQVLRAARLVLPEGPYGELADQLGVPANWPMEERR